MRFIKLLTVAIMMSFNMTVAQDFLLIHGWTGNGSQWNGSAFEQLIQNEILYTSPIHKPTLGGTNSSYNQAMSLKTYINNHNINNGIAIAYSMGGLNTRYYLKHEWGNQKISELYTVGSTLKGTYLANNRIKAVKLLLLGAASILFPGGELINGVPITVQSWDWDIAYIAGSLIFNPLADALINNYGGAAVYDLEVGSEAVTYTNSDTGFENNIIKVGIASTELEPVLYRMGAHVIGATEESVIDVVGFINGYKIIQMINAFIIYAENQTPANFANLSHHLASYSFFKDLNKNWKELILQSNQSDGVVSKSSQEYPNANSQFYVNDGSHLELPYNTDVLVALRTALTFNGHTKVRPIISHFTQSPNPICKGGSGTVTAYLSQGNPPPTYTWEKLSYPPGFNLLNTTGNPCYVVYNNTGLLAPDDYTDAVVRCTVTVAGGGGSDIKNYVVQLVNECPGCPTLAFDVGGEMTDDNPLLITSLSHPGIDVTDYYLVQNPITPVGNKINLRIHEPQTEHTWLDYVELIEAKVKSDELVAVNDEGEVISYKNTTAPVTVLLNGTTDITDILSSMDTLEITLAEGDVLTIQRNAQSPEDGDDGELVLGGADPIKDQESITLSLAKKEDIDSDNPKLGELFFFFRPNKSIIAKKLRSLPPGNLEIVINNELTLNYLALVNNLKTAKVNSLNLLSANHQQSGDVKNLLLGIDQNYAEIFPGDIIDFVFQKGTTPAEKTEYILKSVGRYETDTTSAFKKLAGTGDEELIPRENMLFDNYPNPFNPTTQIKYSVKEDGLVLLKVYDVLGKEVASLVNEEQQAGTHTVTFDAGSLASGIYFYTITAKEFQLTKKMILIK